MLALKFACFQVLATVCEEVPANSCVLLYVAASGTLKVLEYLYVHWKELHHTFSDI